ncbi:MAG: hypothetical protein A2284_03940 [Deltaproteobacteria bacterium RIFOXYA12_FULL_61_11]|nr:MAG: hypothetical protein A2284_03940 [Deltaproteobacteria bacterium RIFOXYA12_FULL_61_11]
MAITSLTLYSCPKMNYGFLNNHKKVGQKNPYIDVIMFSTIGSAPLVKRIWFRNYSISMVTEGLISSLIS